MKKDRAKILCLGVSCPSITAELKVRGHPAVFLDTHTSSPAAAIEAVQRGLLTQMDGRDLARCLATEAFCEVDVCCVSQEKGAIYRKDRHFDGNFNRPSFVRALQKHFNGCRFDSITLDYFWVPTGWNQSHWSRSFFEKTLVSFAQCDLLTDSRSNQLRSKDPCRSGVVHLPFCLHCFKEVIAAFPRLKQHYNISFLRKHELDTIALWAGTQNIDASTLQGALGKRADQEEVYCTFSSRDILGVMEDCISKNELLDIARRLEDFSDTRFIVLESLHTNGMSPNASSPTHSCGRILGLNNSK